MAYSQKELMKRWLIGPWPDNFGNNRHCGQLRFGKHDINAFCGWPNRGFQRNTWNQIAYWKPGHGNRPILSSVSPVNNARPPHQRLWECVVAEGMEQDVDIIPIHLATFGNISLEGLKVIDRKEGGHIQETGPWWSREGRYFRVHEALFTSHYRTSQDKRYFLSGYDRQEPIRNLTHPLFICELPHRVQTIAEAYEALKPRIVKKAESKGIPVRRQGDIFLIKMTGMTSRDFIPKKSSHGCSCLVCRENEVRALRRRILGTEHEGQRVIESDGLTYVSGWLTHRDHNAVRLVGYDSWWIAVRNTAPMRST